MEKEENIEGRATTSEVATVVFQKEDLIELLNWIRNISPYYPDGANGWGNRGFSPYFSVKPETIIKDFIEFRQKQQIVIPETNLPSSK
jgi:hypothetical protein